MRDLLKSVRYTIRLLLKSPTFTIIAVLILGVGIGANTTIFSLLNAVVLNPLPFPHPGRLVSVVNTSKEISDLGVDLPDYVDFRAAQQSFDELAVDREALLDLSDSAGPQKLNAGFVSASLFVLTGKPFIIGRPFTDQEDRFGGPLLAVFTERFWRTHFQSDPNVLGKNVTLSGRSYEIVGVCPTQVDDWGIDSPELYVPVQSVAGADDPVKARDGHYLACYGRLKPGVTMNQAETDLARIQRTLQERYPDINQGYGVRLMLLVSAFSMTALFLSAIGIYGSLAYTVIQRTRELGIRVSLGSTSLGILRLVLRDGLQVVGSGLLAGVLVALGVAGFLQSVLYGVSAHDPIAIGTGIIVLTVVAFTACLLPAIRAARIDPTAVLRSE